MSADFWINAGALAGIYALLALALQLNLGFTGMINFGLAGFMAVGAYAFGILVGWLGWPWWLAVAAAMGLAVGVAAVVGLATAGLRGDHFALATVAFSELIRHILQNTAAFGGNQGVIGYDGGWRDLAAGIGRALGLEGHPQLPLLAVVWATVLVAAVTLAFLSRTPWGRLLEAVRDDETVATTLGKDVAAVRLQSLMIAACLAAVAGILVALNVTYLYPSIFEPTIVFLACAILLIAGLGCFICILPVALVFWALIEGSRLLDTGLPAGREAALRFVLVGLALILFSRLRPLGLRGGDRGGARRR